MSQDEFELNFLTQDQFELQSMEGDTTRYRRARPYAPTVADLTAFAGRYESDELRAVFQMAPGTDGLTVRVNDSPARVAELAPVDRDTFQQGMTTVRFLRDEAGEGRGPRLQQSGAPQNQLHASERPHECTAVQIARPSSGALHDGSGQTPRTSCQASVLRCLDNLIPMAKKTTHTM